jgi:hypothetical protein
MQINDALNGIGAASQVLNGFLAEQEKQKTQQKVQKALESGKYKVKQTINPVTGQTLYELEDKSPIDNLLALAQAADAQTKIYNAGGPSPSMFGGQQTQQTPGPLNLPAGDGNINVGGQGDYVPEKLDMYGRPTGYKINPAVEQGQIAQQKENEVALGKATRLETVGKTMEKEWLKTSPYKGKITGTGLVPVLGLWDVVKKGLGATDAQRQDQAYSDFVQGVRAQLARGMGDVGNLSEYEQRAVIRLLPTLFDSYESGKLKLQKLFGMVEDLRGVRQKRGFSEFTVEGVNYKIPSDKVESFMKAKGLK